MPSRIVVSSKISDARSKVAMRNFEGLGLKSKIKFVALADSYLIDAKLKGSEYKKIGDVLANPLTEQFTINQVPVKSFDWVIEIGFLPGVTDNVGATAGETIADLVRKKFKRDEKVYSSQLFFISGKLPLEEVQKIANSLYNPLIQRAVLKNRRQFAKDKGLDKKPPKVSLKPKKFVTLVDLNVADGELAKIGKQGIVDPDGSRRGPLALELDYMKAIQKHFAKLKRLPTDVEIEAIGQTWSEHCKHTIFANPIDEIKDGLFKHYIKRSTEIIRRKKGWNDFCVSVFTDNSGAIDFDGKNLITHKVETHNTPSALDPFGGAITGIVGVNRDAMGFGLGAKPLVNTYGFCFGEPADSRPLYRDKELTQKMLLPKRIMEGVIKGVNSGGNCSGIPTSLGFMRFNERYRGKPLVFVGTVGLLPKKTKAGELHRKGARPGDYIVMVGGRVGQDGIHGATFSSEAIDAGSPATAVQIGDPITQKKFSDALVKECRDLGLYTSITDNGAGGLSSSVAEMAKESGGCIVQLDKVPVKYPGLEPWKIWISESQERMTLAVPKTKWNALSKHLAKRGVEATVIGNFTNSGKCLVKYKKQTVMDLDMEFLHNGLPKKKLTTKSPKIPSSHKELLPQSSDIKESIFGLLKSVNLASNEFISTQYDHEVQGTSVIKPLQGLGRVNGDAAVVRPLLKSNKGIVLSYGLYPEYSEIDSYHMSAAAIDTAIRSAVAAGADPKKIALLDNFCWCSSNDPIRLYQLKQAVKACFDLAVQFEAPFISGKDSMFNDFTGFDSNGQPVKISIPPTLLITGIGLINDIRNAVTIDAKAQGDLAYLLGETKDETAGSALEQYLSKRDKRTYQSANIPLVNALKNKKLYEDFSRCIEDGLVASSISLASGGLALALCKTAISGRLGLDINLKELGNSASDESALFSESQGRILATINPLHKEEFESLMAGNAIALIGSVTKDSIQIKGFKSKTIARFKTDEAEKVYKSTFKNY